MMNNVIKQIIEKAKSENRNSLTEIEAKQVFKEAGLQVIDTRLASNKKDAVELSKEMGLPVVLKIVSPDILHKTEANGVKLNLKTTNDVAKGFDEIMVSAKEKFPDANIHGVAVQGMAKSGLEIIIGMTLDAQFGPVLMFGLGGIFVEVLKDVSFGITPLTKRDAGEMIRSIKGYPLLNGFRGAPKIDVANLESWLLKLSDFAQTYPEVKEFDLNPIFAYAQGAMVVDARIILK
jgi:acetate---CoA ligase (ADP-forming) subunit beta